MSELHAVECNFDGLVGGSHHYGGLALGNLASAAHQGQVSNPRAAALQGLAKMRRLHDAGLAQGWLPPPLRPDWRFLRQLGFAGTPAQVLNAARKSAPDMLQAAWSAASMWTANAATVSPSADSSDGHWHLTVANLASQVHRALETRHTERHLRHVFGGKHMHVHESLPAVPGLGDEGAANHLRLCARHGSAGVQIFVYGEPGQRFAARQTRAASEAIIRRHGVHPDRCVLVPQAPHAIDGGVFHNDVISVAHRHLLIGHRAAFADWEALCRQIDKAIAACPEPFAWQCEIAEATDFSLQEAVDSYVFNSQLLDDTDGGIWLLGPSAIERHPGVMRWLDRLVDQGRLSRWETMDLTQSMQNGGGPACLRLRAVLTDTERTIVNPAFICTTERLDALEEWVGRHYRDRLAAEDLSDPSLADELATAHSELATMVDWPGFVVGE